MRLLQITASNVWRGHEQQIEYYYDYFNSKIEHQVLLCPTDTKLAQIAADKNYNLHTLPFKSEYDLKWVRKIKSIVKHEKIDLILIHNSNSHTLCVLTSVLLGVKTPMVFFRTLIKNIDTNPFRKWKYNYKHLKKIVCVSNAVKDVLKPSIKDHSRFSIVGSATNPSDFDSERTHKLRQELNLKPNTKLVANISAFVGFKDHYTFIKTAKVLNTRHDNLVFALIGKGEMEDEMKAFAKEQNVNNIHFLGFRNDIPEIFADFDVFLFTSKLEPTGGVLLEAYASHVPIVATNYGGIPEVIVNNETGLLAEKENPEDFANKVTTILNDDMLKHKLTKNGYVYLQEHFTKDVIASKMLNELLSVLK